MGIIGQHRGAESLEEPHPLGALSCKPSKKVSKEPKDMPCQELAYCILSAYCKLHIECSTFNSIIFQDLE